MFSQSVTSAEDGLNPPGPGSLLIYIAPRILGSSVQKPGWLLKGQESPPFSIFFFPKKSVVFFFQQERFIIRSSKAVPGNNLGSSAQE